MGYCINKANISLPIGWLLCTGAMFSCPKRQAIYNLGRLMRLPNDAQQTPEDARVVDGLLSKHVTGAMSHHMARAVVLRFTSRR